MVPEPDSAQQRILLVTGLLGAGKTTALNVLEDLGWETIDNFPIRLLERLLATTAPRTGGDDPAPLAIGFDSRTRGFDPVAIIGKVGELAKRGDLAISTMFLDCADPELLRRYNETRRRHPLALDKPLVAGIAAEREMLAPLRQWADMIIATTDFSANQLQQAVRERFGDIAGGGTTVTIWSFGFARGTPPLADIVFDVRFLDNPHWVDELRPLTGRDQPVADHIRRDPAFDEAFERIRDLLLLFLPRYAAQGKAYVNVAFGCTGGRHRSVFMAEEIARALRESGFAPTLLHRNLDARAADLLEDAQP
jgi:RNase adapter protein RapZ